MSLKIVHRYFRALGDLNYLKWSFSIALPFRAIKIQVQKQNNWIQHYFALPLRTTGVVI